MVNAALLTPNLTMGGAEMWVVSLIHSSDRRRLRWTGAVVSGWGGLDRHLCRQLAKHVPVHTNDGGWNQQPGARRIAERYFDRIHEHFGDAIRAASCEADVLVAWGGIDIKRYAPDLAIPIVQTSHTTVPAESDASYASASHWAAVSEAAKAYFSTGQNRSITVIYNGADWRHCEPVQGRAAMRKQWRISEGDVAVGYLGRHSPEKYPQAAIAAVARLPANHYAVYYGGPTPRDQTTTRQLRQLAGQRAPGRVIFRSPIEQVGDVLAGLDVFMLASRREAFSLGLIEAWLAGVPVVATPVGSLPELERRFGQLTIQVPIDAKAATLAAAVRRASDDAGRVIAERARTVAFDHFTSKAMGQRWADYLQSIVAPCHRRYRGRAVGEAPSPIAAR